MPGLLDLLPLIIEQWQTNREQIDQLTHEIKQSLIQLNKHPSSSFTYDFPSLAHQYSSGVSEFEAVASDYANVIWGLIELYHVTFDFSLLSIANELTSYALTHFLNSESSGLFYSSDTVGDVLVRTVETYDGATPSSNAVFMYDLLLLGHLLNNTYYLDLASSMVTICGKALLISPSNFAFWLVALDFAESPTYELVLVVNTDLSEAQPFLDVIQSQAMNHSVILLKKVSDTNLQLLEELVPISKTYTLIDNLPTAYLCENFTCNLPTTNPEDLSKYMSE